MSTAALSFTPSINNLHLNTGVLGNVSQTDLGEFSSPQQQVQTHLKYVLDILESGQFAPANLTEPQKYHRNACIIILRDYMLAGVFPHQFRYPDPSATHRPCFKDDANNVCAVGHLLEKTVGMQVVDQINSLFKFAYIRDMDLTLIEQWKSEYGFSRIELAMIQPSYSLEKHMHRNDILIPQIPYTVHVGVRCDVCGATPIAGARYKCVNCPNFDMCANCESNDSYHDQKHVFLKLKHPITKEPDHNTALLPNITVNVTQPTHANTYSVLPSTTTD